MNKIFIIENLIQAPPFVQNRDKNLSYRFSICRQCDQIGLFLKYFGYKFSSKNWPNIYSLFGYFEKYHFLSKNCCGYFRTKLGYFLFKHAVTLFAGNIFSRYFCFVHVLIVRFLLTLFLLTLVVWPVANLIKPLRS